MVTSKNACLHTLELLDSKEMEGQLFEAELCQEGSD